MDKIKAFWYARKNEYGPNRVQFSKRTNFQKMLICKKHLYFVIKRQKRN